MSTPWLLRWSAFQSVAGNKEDSVIEVNIIGLIPSFVVRYLEAASGIHNQEPAGPQDLLREDQQEFDRRFSLSIRIAGPDTTLKLDRH